MSKPAEALRRVATAQSGPRWLHLIGYLGVAITTGLGVWSQTRDAFPEWFEPVDIGYVEYQQHFMEMPTDNFFDVMGLGMIKVSYYPSDGCLFILRPGRPGQWFQRNGAARSSNVSILPVDPPGVVHAAGAQQCLNPHPGEFRTRNGKKVERDGWLWVEIWRLYPDGCEHFQLLRADGQWDTNRDGSPRVTWVNCVH